MTRPGLMLSARLLIPLAALLGVTLYQPDSGTEVRDFFNPLLADGADPWVYRHTDGRYYLLVTTSRDVTLIRSESLTGLAAGERRVVWTPPPAGPTSSGLWAPELHFLRNKWYVYVAADDGENANHRMYVLENDSPDPFTGEFILRGKVADPTADLTADRWAIDGTVLDLRGRLYFLWSGWEGTADVSQELYIAPMADSWTLSGPRVEISRPTLPWETRGAPPTVNEGPQVLVRGNTVNVVYSASGSWTDHYCLGLLTASADADLLDPKSWTKHPRPVFESGNGVLAPGHCSFTVSPDGTQDWLLYHSAKYSGARWNRSVRAQRFTWASDGTPRFGQPAPTGAAVALPAGEPPRRRYEAESAVRGGTATVQRHPCASSLSMVGPLDTGSYLELAVTAGRSGRFQLVIRYRNDAPDQEAATQTLTVNGGPGRTVRYAHLGSNNLACVAARVELQAGLNRLRFSPGLGAVHIDCVDVVPDAAQPPNPAAGTATRPALPPGRAPG